VGEEMAYLFFNGLSGRKKQGKGYMKKYIIAVALLLAFSLPVSAQQKTQK
jgi:hypothetical protein